MLITLSYFISTDSCFQGTSRHRERQLGPAHHAVKRSLHGIRRQNTEGQKDESNLNYKVKLVLPENCSLGFRAMWGNKIDGYVFWI